MQLLDNPLVVTILLSIWGLAVKYLPALKDVPNRLIPVMTLILAVLAKLATPTPAEAAPGWLISVGHGLGWLLPPLQVIIQRQIYESFIKPTLEHFGVKGSPTPPVEALAKG